ncbi:MAG: hypothetical protein E5Y34_06540 [Mesorhizobium sp.]|uniref:hypothetical protein n=1 Tax=Mesorhizobium sp. TaxID=1871066 RepID=UPI0011FF73EE|nr:hypothetical protein [Mesorhizobium sp.]TIN02682.1 MAG: hypothetical protein E5Y34_06540 [Mesorhizobium sp.]
MSNQFNTTNLKKMHRLALMERMAASAQAYKVALAEYVAAQGLKPIWYSLADDADFNFGFVCRFESA